MAKGKPYDWTRFFLRIEIAAPPEKVYRAWTDGDFLAQWFSVRAAVEPKKGGRVYFEWLGGDKLETRVLQARKPSLFRFPFGSHGEEVEVKIRQVPGGSVCELQQTNMKTTPRMKVAMHMGCKTGWVFFLTNLKAFLEHGVDLRSHDPQKSYNQNYLNS